MSNAYLLLKTKNVLSAVMLLFLDSIKRPSYSKETSEAKIPHLVTNDDSDSDSYFDYNYVHMLVTIYF